MSAYIKTAMHGSRDEQVLRRTIKPWTGLQGMGAFYRQIAQADSWFTDEVEEVYADIDRPVLILWGEQDSWIPVQRGEELGRLLPNSRLVTVPDAGHLVIEERPDELVSHIATFLGFT